jgi:hypothetical protein
MESDRKDLPWIKHLARDAGKPGNLHRLSEFIMTKRYFVTSKCLADKFDSYRTRADDHRIQVRLPDNKTICGFLGLYDGDIAIVTAFTMPVSTP